MSVDMAELGPDIWNPAGVRILGTLWATTIPWRTSSRNGWWRSGNGGTLSPSQTCNVRGSSRRASMSSSVAHGSTTVCRTCAWARFWDAAHDRSIVGEDPRKPDAGRDGTQHHHSAHEDRRSHLDALGCSVELQESVSRLDRDGFIVPLLGDAATRCPTSLDPCDRGAWRMESRMAVPFVFQFRTPFSGDGCACSVVRC